MWMPGYRPKGFGCFPYVASRVAIVAVATGFLSLANAQDLTGDDTARRDAAIIAARGGDYNQALATLDALRTEYPGNVSLIHDEVTVLAWSENDGAALELAADLDPGRAPRYTQLAVAKSARNLKRFDLAAEWYDAALASDANDADALSGRLMTAADAGDRATVRAIIARIDVSASPDLSVALARAYALLTVGDSLPALAAYNAILDAAPDQVDALRGKALVLRSMLLPTQALELAAEHPGILSETEIERLRSDEAAIRLRLTTRTPYPAPSVYQGTERSLASIDEALADATTEAARNVLLLDRVVALSDANEARAAIEQFESLPETANRDQPYVLASAARAYLQAKQPKDAVRLLERAREIDPASLDVRFTLVYAYLDLERYDDALNLTTELITALPKSHQAAGSNVIKGNEDRLRAEILAGISEAYADQLDAAQTRFEALLREAPNNAEVRQELANVYRWRGWLDRSLDEYRQVLTTNDEMLSAELGLAHAKLDAREYAAVDMAVAEVSPIYNRNPAVQNLTERWSIHNERELSIEAQTGDSSGPVSGANNYSVDVRWYTSPLHYRYRAFVATHDGYGEFPEGVSRRQRIGTGIEYRSPRFKVEGMISGSRSGGEAGVAGRLDYRHSDFWTLSFGLESDSDAVQLRAQRLGIDADRGFVSAEFAPNELAGLSLGFDRLSYSDGNRLESLYADGRFRLVNQPRSKLDATGSLAFGRAATSAVPYFSPTHDRTLSVGIEHRYRIHRRYERQIVQTIGLGAGRYFQSGYKAGPTWSVRYRLDFTLGDRLSLGIEADRLGQTFDGVREHSTLGLVSLVSRF
jgi:biofilm PGA synthesis protein PgaA